MTLDPYSTKVPLSSVFDGRARATLLSLWACLSDRSRCGRAHFGMVRATSRHFGRVSSLSWRGADFDGRGDCRDLDKEVFYRELPEPF